MEKGAFLLKVTPIITKQKYESVADQIIVLIRNHTFREGSHLPTENGSF